MRKKIALLTTGGTIAGVSHGNSFEDCTGKMVRPYKVELSGQEVISEFPSLGEIADIELLDLGVIDSPNMKYKDWCHFAKNLFTYLSRDDIAGTVLTHGTDTLEFTLIALALALRNLNKPVVVTGAMLPIDQDRIHVQRHLEDSVITAANSGINEVTLCFSGDRDSNFTNIYRGVNAYKRSTRGSNAFDGYCESPIASVVEGELVMNSDYAQMASGAKPRLQAEFEGKFLPLTLIGNTPGGLRCLEKAIEEGAKGLLLDQQSGLGVNSVNYEIARRALEAGIPVAVRSGFRINANLTESENDEYLKSKGAIPLGRMKYSKAWVKFAWVLAQTGGDIQKTGEMMLKNYAGEILHKQPYMGK